MNKENVGGRRTSLNDDSLLLLGTAINLVPLPVELHIQEICINKRLLQDLTIKNINDKEKIYM